MKIVALEAQNVKRLVAVNIKPDGNLVVIGGKNGAGKTSVLDSIMYALGGKSAVPSKPIREGQEKATIKVDLDDLTVIRTFTAKGSSVKVMSKDGASYGSPQAMLDKLVGRLSFDPLDFARMKPGDQAATLRELVGIDHTALDQERKALYEERTAINRDAKRLTAQVEGLAESADVPAEPVSIADLSRELDRRRIHNQGVDDLEEGVQKLADRCRRLADQVANLEQQLEQARKDHEAATIAHTQARDGLAQSERLDTDDIIEQIGKAEETNRFVAQNAERKRLAEQAQQAKAESDDLSDRIDAIDHRKANEIASATFPIDGLSFGDGEVLMNGIPFEQCSAAEQLRASVAIGLAMNPELRVVLIRDASLMDEDTLAMVGEMAEQNDAQLWLERVGEGAECSVVIEDGAVREPVTA